MKIPALICLVTASAMVQAQTVVTHQKSASGERVLHIEATVHATPERVWKAFATEEGARCWVAPAVKLDFRTGGSMQSNYDAKAGVGGPGTIRLGITNVVENELLTYKVKLTDSFSKQLQSEDGNLQEVIRLERQPNGGTRIVTQMLGWGTGAEWDKAYDFFAKGNEWTIAKLVKCVGPVRSSIHPEPDAASGGDSNALPLSSAPTQPSPKLAPMAFLAARCWRGTLPDGKSVDTHCFEWLLNGHYLHDHHIVHSPGRPDYVGESLYYFDHERQQVAYIYYENLGNYSRGLMIGDDRKLDFPQADFFHRGGKLTYRARWERLDENSLQATSEFLKEGTWVIEQSVKFVKVPR
jgi:uncharacterized protein YndB with AHSA1/START domain